MKIRILMLGILMGLFCSELHAGVVITTSDLQTIEALINDVASLSWDGNFKDGNLVINYTDGTTRRLAIALVEGITFTEDESDGISQRADADASVTIYDLQGRLILNGVKAESIKSLPTGQYIIRNKDITIKYLKK